MMMNNLLACKKKLRTGGSIGKKYTSIKSEKSAFIFHFILRRLDIVGGQINVETNCKNFAILDIQVPM